MSESDGATAMAPMEKTSGWSVKRTSKVMPRLVVFHRCPDAVAM